MGEARIESENPKIAIVSDKEQEEVARGRILRSNEYFYMWLTSAKDQFSFMVIFHFGP